MDTPRETQAPTRPRMIAAGAAAALLLASGWTSRAIDARVFGNVPSPASIPHLARLPLQIEDWSGQDVPIEQRLREATDAEDLLNRRYGRSMSADVVGVYLAAGNRARDLARHRPEVCYPGAGWSLRRVESATLAPPGAAPLACRVFEFSEGGFDLRRLIVVNYFIVDGVNSPDITLLRWKAWRGVGAMLQVQVTCATDTFRDLPAARALALEFAERSAHEIRKLLDQPAAGHVSAQEPS